MKVPRDVNGAEAVRALRRAGYETLRQTGSHIIMRKDTRTVVAPQHKPIKPGFLSQKTRARPPAFLPFIRICKPKAGKSSENIC